MAIKTKHISALPQLDAVTDETTLLVVADGNAQQLSMQTFIDYLKENGLGGGIDDGIEEVTPATTFTVNPFGQFTFDEGMTWDDWLMSSHNKHGLYYYDEYGGHITKDGEFGFDIGADSYTIVADSVYTYVNMVSGEEYFASPNPFTIEGYGVFYHEMGCSWEDWLGSLYNTRGYTYDEASGCIDLGDGYGVMIAGPGDLCAEMGSYTPVKI